MSHFETSDLLIPALPSMASQLLRFCMFMELLQKSTEMSFVSCTNQRNSLLNMCVYDGRQELSCKIIDLFTQPREMVSSASALISLTKKNQTS